MRISSIILGLAIFVTQCATDAFAQPRSYESRFQPFLTRGETTWSLSGGVRKDDYKWNIAGDESGANPNILNEQTFNDNYLLELKAKVRHIEPMDIGFVKGGLLIEGQVTGGYTLDGNGTLSSYLGDNRTLEASRQTFNNLSGDAIGGVLTLGYQINLTGTPAYRAREIMSKRRPRTSRGQIRQARALSRAFNNAGPYLSVTPLFGFAIDQQTYHREDAYQHIPVADPDAPPVGYFHTESTAVANWYGPFIGLEGEIKTYKNMLRLRGELHDLTYYGKRLEPSRADDLEQDPTEDSEADGTGLLLNAEYAYALGKDYALTMDATYKYRKAEDGTTSLYPLNSDAIVRKLNEAENSTAALHVGFRYNW